jgi:hypothetical protein
LSMPLWAHTGQLLAASTTRRVERVRVDGEAMAAGSLYCDNEMMILAAALPWPARRPRAGLHST